MNIPTVKNMESPRTNKPVANQYIIEIDKTPMSGNCTEVFQSYQSIIAIREKFTANKLNRQVTLDKTYWNYSRTTSKYRSIFLNESTKETQQKIDSGEYTLANLN